MNDSSISNTVGFRSCVPAIRALLDLQTSNGKQWKGTSNNLESRTRADCSQRHGTRNSPTVFGTRMFLTISLAQSGFLTAINTQHEPFLYRAMLEPSGPPVAIKTDIRVYGIVTSLEPLRLYLSKRFFLKKKFYFIL